ncbi:holo-(acyl-carrier-protein) synthase [secondary endosymbiont of Heteropsylla cubana]|uniref:Holo-[acyl-carrier-protein] synthase n=1 Tax=secondary endosymbiont of Heteropsylla cubana TaxID=134287 RepID=J3YT12_9ENTR|nr:holo-ACP synthase [secondary endosymbiont of Heteropsylla cubana]AFP85513.1 holo-(acyl-carrier-protein) synthase [secondary endosymbiont of Heteropsylla cubana]
MTIFGIGTDIIEIKRIAGILYRTGDRLPRRILSPDEWQEYKNHNHPERFLSKRFAVKEAASKALGTGFRNGVAFYQFEVYKDVLGKPSLRLFDQAAILFNWLRITSTHITLSDEKKYAYATVVFER